MTWVFQGDLLLAGLALAGEGRWVSCEFSICMVVCCSDINLSVAEVSALADGLRVPSASCGFSHGSVVYDAIDCVPYHLRNGD